MNHSGINRCLQVMLLLAFPVLAHALDTGITYVVYHTPDNQSYLEVNLEVAASSVMYRHVDSTQMQAGAEVLMLITRDGKVVNYEKYKLQSPLVKFPETLLDVKRFNIDPGDYSLDVTVTDVNDEANVSHFNRSFQVKNEDQVALSDIQLLRGFRPDNSDNSFTKNGFYLEPLPFNFYDRNATTLAFYAEMYHTDKAITADKYRVRYVVEKELGNNQRSLIAAGSQDKKPGPIDALLVQMDISKLQSGNYNLTVELRTIGNDLLTSKTLTFQRSNPFLDFQDNELTPEVISRQFVQQLDKDKLTYALRAISPLMIGDQSEMLVNVLKEGDVDHMRFTLFKYFAEKDPNNPEQAYRDYMVIADAADKKFRSGFRYGFETDRGRTFLRFGQASDIVHVEDEPGAPPYEIWIYYKFPKTGQNNVKFLFYNPSLAGEDYILLHSTARGEISNPKWERELYKRNPTEYTDGNYGDATGTQRNNGRNAKAYFEDF